MATKYFSQLSLAEHFQDCKNFFESDASKFTRFKQDFLPFLEQMFSSMVDYTEPICMAIDATLASTITFDTTGIELYVKENNPKTLNALIKRLKSYYKNNPSVDPYKMAYGLMPSQAASSSVAKQMYINGHFCYADKLAIITNGLGIILHIAFLDDELKINHPDMVVKRKLIHLTKISLLVILQHLNPYWKISF